MALVPIISQTWDTTSYVNPTRMNNIEDNIAIVSKATGVEYSSGVSVKDKIDDLNEKMTKVHLNATTDSNGNINSNLLASEYIYFGTTRSVSMFFIPLNALSDGKIRIRVLDSNMNPAVSTSIDQDFYFWKL